MSTAISPQRWHLVSPHAYYDLVRIARRGRNTFVRVLYGLALLAALTATYFDAVKDDSNAARQRARFGLIEADAPINRVSESINRSARIAEGFSITVLVAQNIAVLVLLPLYIAASIQEERDRQTFPILFTTHLTAREIVLGKWLSRCAHVGVILLSGLPVLAVAQLWGGIDMEMIAANFCNTFLLLLSVGAVSVYMAMHSRSVPMTLLKTYLFLVACFIGSIGCACVLGWSDPMSLLLLRPSGGGADSYAQMWKLAAQLTLLHVASSLFFLGLATNLMHRQRAGDERSAEAAKPRWLKDANRFRQFPDIGDNAIAWKERYLDGSHWAVMPIFWMPLLLGLHLIHITVWSHTRSADGFGSSYFLLDAFMWIMIAGAAGYILVVTLRLTGTVVRERERQSLDLLLLLPMSTAEFLRALVIANMQRHWASTLPFATTWLVVLFFGGLTPWPGLLLLLAVTVHLGFFAMLGLYISAISRTSVAAYVSVGLLLLAILAGTLALPLLVPDLRTVCYALNPIACWITITQDWWRADEPTNGTAIAGCLFGYFGAGLALCSLSHQRLAHRSAGV